MFNPVTGGHGGAQPCHQGERGEGNNEGQHLKSLWQSAHAEMKQIRQDEQKLQADERHHAGERKIENDEHKELADIEKLIGTLFRVF
jgi:hypothetical protein